MRWYDMTDEPWQRLYCNFRFRDDTFLKRMTQMMKGLT